VKVSRFFTGQERGTTPESSICRKGPTPEQKKNINGKERLQFQKKRAFQGGALDCPGKGKKCSTSGGERPRPFDTKKNRGSMKRKNGQDPFLSLRKTGPPTGGSSPSRRGRRKIVIKEAAQSPKKGRGRRRSCRPDDKRT